jgi:A/G-specific adenine glycosylase
MQNLRLASKLLLDWYAASRRDLPWRRTRDPWRILVSEVMLQQTRVAAVIPYYERFLRHYPEAKDLAAAPEQQFLALWAGLGYYARARNLRRAARVIAENGSFPRDFEGIRDLPGVGDYTAAAISSICFGLPHAVLDGNVLRVLARAGAEKGDIGSATVRARLREQAQRLLDPRRPADFNQAIMELGATVCLPRNPQCLLCPWREHCAARALGIEQELPVKLRKRDPVKLAIELLVVEKEGRLLLRQRGPAESRLAGFWELPEARDMPSAQRGQSSGSFQHSITRHDYTIEVYPASAVKAPKGFRWFTWPELASLPLSTMTRKALDLLPRAASDPVSSKRP